MHSKNNFEQVNDDQLSEWAADSIAPTGIQR